MELARDLLNEYEPCTPSNQWVLSITHFPNVRLPFLTHDLINHLSTYIARGEWKYFIFVCKAFYNTNSVNVIDQRAHVYDTLYKWIPNNIYLDTYYLSNLHRCLSTARKNPNYEHLKFDVVMSLMRAIPLYKTYTSDLMLMIHLMEGQAPFQQSESSFTEQDIPQVMFMYNDNQINYDDCVTLKYAKSTPHLKWQLDMFLHSPNLTREEFEENVGVLWEPQDIWKWGGITDDVINEIIDKPDFEVTSNLIKDYMWECGEAFEPSTIHKLCKIMLNGGNIKSMKYLFGLSKLSFETAIEIRKYIKIDGDNGEPFIFPLIIAWFSLLGHIPTFEEYTTKVQTLVELYKTPRYLPSSIYEGYIQEVFCNKSLSLSQKIELLKPLMY